MTSVFLVTRVGPASQYNGCLFQEGIKHEAHCMPALASRDIEADPMVSLCQSHPINVHTQKRICKQTCLLSDALTLKWTHTPPAPPTYHLVWVFSVASYLLAGGSTLFFYCLLYHQRTRFHFLFFSVQNRNITGLSACPPPHTCAHKRHTHTQRHTDPHSPWTCLLLFPCQQQKKQKKRLKREMKGVLKGGNWKRRDMHSCVFERQSSLSKREKGGPIKEVTRLSLSFYAFMEWWWYVYVCWCMFSYTAV